MSDNPYQSPKEPSERTRQSGAPPLDENVKEFLGIAKEDFWYYPGFVLLVVACFVSDVAVVVILFAASTVFLIVYSVKSFPKYAASKELASVTRLYGLFGNVGLILLQVVAIAGKSWFMIEW